MATVCDVERQACREFFAGKASKTPERYMMIRNYMVEAWQAAQPQYLTKIRARAGLKNCGDVNAIGRIHTFLERARIINAGAERSRRSQTAAATVTKTSRRRLHHQPTADSDDDDDGGGGGGGGGGDSWHVPRGSASATAGRRRRVRDEDGNWVYEDEYYGGHVISHDV
ncbi:Myb-like, SWIRM and MPN domains 1, partial [Coemansia sp. RSA 25]